ncbi:MAG: DUF4012 domain-containing protein [Ilumatobacteraceae bacterium]
MIIDDFLLVVTVSACIWLIATAPWARRWQRTLRPIITALVVAVVLQVVARLGNILLHGFTAALGVVPVLLVTLLAIHRQSGHHRLKLWSAFGAVAAAAILAMIGLGVAAASARPDLTNGAETTMEALQALKLGDFDSARDGFRRAADLLGSAVDDLETPWAQPSRFLPVVAQHRRAASDLAKSTESVSRAIVDVLGEIDFDRLRVVNGTIDIGAITALHDPLSRLYEALADLRSTVDAVDSQWLVDPIRKRLATFVREIDDEQVEGERAMLAVQRTPAMLGANGPRVYFIAFTTPAESRGLGGSMGNWAEVTIDSGRFSVTGFGRTADLAVDGNTERWERVTSSPHFPDVAKSIAEGYPAFSGHDVDGVFAMDVYTVAAFIKMTGPIDLTSAVQTVSVDNAATLLLSDQYAVAQNGAERIDLIEEVAGTTLGRLLTTSLPAPPDLVELLSPLATQGRLDGWARRPSEQELFQQMRISGELPVLHGGDGLAIVVNNVGNNKIDYYLTGEVLYSVDTDAASGMATAGIEITLRNSAPAGALEPAIVFGNSAGAPPGTNLMDLSVYSALPVTEVTGDGQPPATTVDVPSHGFNITTRVLQISALSTTHIHMELAGPLDLSVGYHAVIRNGASVIPLKMTVFVDGDPIDESTMALAGLHTIDL